MEYQKSSSSSNDTYYTNERWESMIRVRDEEDELLNNGLRKGPWSPEEDSKLSSAIATHGVGRWNTLAVFAGLKRSGKSCRLRWLNYLRPDLRRGTFTLDEQLRILELHFSWGNRWSKIAEHLPGRTDNEIKNYWRTKVQKLARQFQCHVNSPQFRNALRNIWIPRLVEQIQAGATTSSNTTKAQIHGPTYDSGNGLLDGFYCSSSTSSDNCCFFDTPLSWAQNSYIVGPEELCPKPNVSTDSSEAHISPVSGSSVELDQNWDQINDYLREMTLNDEDNMLFWETLHN
ncbi:transcription factor MYB2-like [Chenopodium quinoa]|uniref:Uncharacterized protein n=1 Tax=Chenopodium quinoa TaxID=63459 RepID=A0A803LEZ5_CHEQI|nr:transcription factor MYB2-like [Chenopodium quinoa]